MGLELDSAHATGVHSAARLVIAARIAASPDKPVASRIARLATSRSVGQNTIGVSTVPIVHLECQGSVTIPQRRSIAAGLNRRYRTRWVGVIPALFGHEAK